MGLFFIPKLSTKHLYFLFFSIFAFLRDVISYINYNDYLDRSDEKRFKENSIQKRYFDIITNVISDCLQGLIVLFHRKKVNNILNDSNNEIEMEYPFYDKILINENKDNNSSFGSFFKIMAKICSVDFFCQFIFLFFALIYDKDEIILRKNNNYLLIVDILSRFIFCRIILGTFFYKHHYFSMFINCVIFIILGAFDIHFIFKDHVDTKKILYFIFLIIQTAVYSLEDVLNKIALTKESLTPYSLLFYKGLFQVPLVLITTIIVLPIKNAFNKFNHLDSGYKKYILVKRAIFIVFNALRSIFLVKVIDTFSSQHLSILKVLESIFMFGFFLFNRQYENQNEKVYIPIISICFIITIFTSLIYNEILVINLCGMQDYTQHGLDIQAEKDLRDAITEISEMSSDVSDTSICTNDSIIAQNVSYTD